MSLPKPVAHRHVNDANCVYVLDREPGRFDEPLFTADQIVELMSRDLAYDEYDALLRQFMAAYCKEPKA